MAKLTVENEIIPPLSEKAVAALDLEGDELTRRASFFDNLDLSINPVVADRLFAKRPAKLF
jgi:hypothetical protein